MVIVWHIMCVGLCKHVILRQKLIAYIIQQLAYTPVRGFNWKESY